MNSMKRAWLVLALMASACGASGQNDLSIVNDSMWSETLALDVIATTEAIAGDGLNLSNYTLHMRAHLGDGCVNDDAGCSNVGARVINVPFPDPVELGWTQDVTRATIAGVLCHELGHVWYFEREGDSDHNHVHAAEWFDYNAAGSVCYRVANEFANEGDQ